MLFASMERIAPRPHLRQRHGHAAPQIGIGRVAAVVQPPEKGADAPSCCSPPITTASDESDERYEGCLSSFDIRGLVPRPLRISVETTTLYGTIVTTVYVPVSELALGNPATLLRHGPVRGVARCRRSLLANGDTGLARTTGRCTLRRQRTDKRVHEEYGVSEAPGTGPVRPPTTGPSAPGPSVSGGATQGSGATVTSWRSSSVRSRSARAHRRLLVRRTGRADRDQGGPANLLRPVQSHLLLRQDNDQGCVALANRGPVDEVGGPPCAAKRRGRGGAGCPSWSTSSSASSATPST
ncbi:peptide deformylase [Streptomyces sp. ISL-98]|uniref:peptide deformylase n=1 Tax=Streptomyces sp. ISL-98 TaxID=2819192 RepID=UPI0027E43F8E|nr:peptide deformylase [Streptomyces sp. ISL-98]